MIADLKKIKHMFFQNCQIRLLTLYMDFLEQYKLTPRNVRCISYRGGLVSYAIISNAHIFKNTEREAYVRSLVLCHGNFTTF